MPICFAQGIAYSETVCAIFTEQKPNDWEAQSKLFATGAMSNRLYVRDLFAENKYRGQCRQTITDLEYSNRCRDIHSVVNKTKKKKRKYGRYSVYPWINYSYSIVH